MPGAAPPRDGRAALPRRWRRAPPGPARQAPAGRPSSALIPGPARRLAVPAGVLPAPAPRRLGRRVGPVVERRGRRNLLGLRDQLGPWRGFLVRGRGEIHGGFGGV